MSVLTWYAQTTAVDWHFGHSDGEKGGTIRRGEAGRQCVISGVANMAPLKT